MILSSPSEFREEALEIEIEPRTYVPVQFEFDRPTLRALRRRALERAAYYRDNYRREGFGFERRMFANMLAQALEYRREEKR